MTGSWLTAAVFVIATCAAGSRLWEEEERATPPRTAQQHVLDITFNDRDWNGVPLDPWWSGQVSPKYSPVDPNSCNLSNHFKCDTSQPTNIDALKQGSLLHPCPSHFGPRGHVNWQTVSYNRLKTLRFDGWGAWPFDGDYDFSTEQLDSRGQTTGNSGDIGAEAKAAEFTDHFTSPWWIGFRNRVFQRCADPTAPCLPPRNGALISGLLGLDGVHLLKTELHPIFAVALRGEADNNAERWALAARNSGNEGDCSLQIHFIDVRSWTFRIPWQKAAVRVGQRCFFASEATASAVDIRIARGIGVFVTLPLADPLRRSRVHGELQLRWLDSGDSGDDGGVCPAVPAAALLRKESVEAVIARVRQAGPVELETDDGVLARLRQMSDEQLRQRIAAWQRLEEDLPLDRHQDSSILKVNVTIGEAPARVARPPREWSQLDADKRARLEILERMLE